MKRLLSLASFLLISSSTPLALSAAFAIGVQTLFEASAQAKNTAAVASDPRGITVRIEGAVHGSGIIVKRQGRQYTVLTAWHVIGQQNSGEEIDIYTSKGRMHKVEKRSIKKIDSVDLGLLTFSSDDIYPVARIKEQPYLAERGNMVVVTGYPIDSNSALISRSGQIVANATAYINEGYQLLYTNKTSTGMSGGPVLDTDGWLVAVHGRGEVNRLKYSLSGRLTKTGINQGIPIKYYKKFESGVPMSDLDSHLTTTDDYLVKAKYLDATGTNFREIIRLTSTVIDKRDDALAYFLRGDANKLGLRRERDAISDYTRAIQINPTYTEAYLARGSAFLMVKDYQSAIEDYTYVIDMLSSEVEYLPLARLARGAAFSAINKLSNAFADYNWIISNAKAKKVIVSPAVLKMTVRGLVSSVYRVGNRQNTCYFMKEMQNAGFDVAGILPRHYCR